MLNNQLSCCQFGSTLHYVSPAHGGWGVIRIAALVPESYQLFVSPFACGRHGALGGAVNGIKDRISYVYIDESDIVSGGYEDLIPEAVDELLAFLPKKPKVLLIFVSCLDDLLGTDHVQLNKRLAEKYPEIKFRSCHMNPFKMDTKFPPGVTLQNNIYSLLNKSETYENSINLIGNHAPIDQSCELCNIMATNNYQVKHITDFERFEDFQTMAKSQLNLLLSPVAQYAAEEMVKNLSIAYMPAYNTYDVEEISDFYAQLAEKLHISINISEYELAAKAKIKEALTVIDNYPIAIDYQAVKKPFTLARALHNYGFNVALIMTDGTNSIERDAYEWVLSQPKIRVVNALHPDLVKFENRGQHCLCIGFDCGYATGSNKIVDLLEDESLFGFYGIEKLMTDMISAFENETSVKELIEGAGLVI